MMDIYGGGALQQPVKKKITDQIIQPRQPEPMRQAPMPTFQQDSAPVSSKDFGAPSSAGDIIGGILGSVGQAVGGGGGQEEQYPEAPTWMPNQGVIGKQPFEAPRLPEMASGLGQAAIL